MNNYKKGKKTYMKEDLKVLNQEPTEQEVKEAERKAKIDNEINNVVDERNKEKFKQMLEEAKLPILLKNEDFKMGEGELDVRALTPRNYKQLQYRLDVLKCARLMSIDQSLTDIQRLLMVVLKKLGVENLTETLTDTMNSLVDEMNKLAK